MQPRLLMMALLAALLLSSGFIAPAVAGAEKSLQQEQIVLSVGCALSPERTKIVNETNRTLDLSTFTLGSIYQPRANEPFRLSGTLAPGAGVTFETGTGAAENPLTNQEIYANGVAGEGARLTTPFGRLDVLCSATIGSLPFTGASVPPPVPPPSPPTQPQLPRTGGGGMADAWQPATGLAALLGALALGGGVALRRRRAA